MKVLIISNNDNNAGDSYAGFIEGLLAKKGYDIIVYHDFIKSIDNMPEIRPEIVIISTDEYPRLWKTLGSFLQSGIAGSDIRLFLYNKEPLSEEEYNKSKVLGIECCISDFNDDVLRKYFPDKKHLYENVIITNPDDNSLLAGEVIYFDNTDLECRVDSDNLENGQMIKYITVYSESEMLFLSANVTEYNKEKGILSLSVCEYYE